LTTNACGTWVPAQGNGDGFSVGGSSPNAIEVVASRDVNHIFGSGMAWKLTLPVSAKAIAEKTPPTAVFSVGSQLLRINGHTPLGDLLTTIGVNLDKTTVLGYDGLSQVKITPGGLLQALNIPIDSSISVGDFNELLASHKISLGELLDASATIISKSQAAGIDLNALKNALKSSLDIDQINIPLGSEDERGGIFAEISTPSTTSALNSDLNLLDVITTSISIAASGRGVSIPNLNILGLITAQVGIVEPPSIGVGTIGATAYNSQIRLFLDIDTNNIPAIGSVLGILGTRVHLPLYIDVIDGYGKLKSAQCDSDAPTATIEVTSSILDACIGHIDQNGAFSTTNACESELQNEKLATVLGITLINNKIPIQALSDTQDVTLGIGETKSTSPNQLAIGTSVSNIVSALVNVMTATENKCGLVCNILDTTLKPVLDGVGYLLSTTLANVLGIELGRTDVHLQSLQCHGTQLVY
jgi:uncharacterized membrane protein